MHIPQAIYLTLPSSASADEVAHALLTELAPRIKAEGVRGPTFAVVPPELVLRLKSQRVNFRDYDTDLSAWTWLAQHFDSLQVHFVEGPPPSETQRPSVVFLCELREGESLQVRVQDGLVQARAFRFVEHTPEQKAALENAVKLGVLSVQEKQEKLAQVREHVSYQEKSLRSPDAGQAVSRALDIVRSEEA